MADGRSDIRNVLFLVADEWRGDSLGSLGRPGMSTPHLDALAADGVTFTNHWCNASPCGPARTAFLTGTRQHTNRVWANDTPADPAIPTIAARCRANGIDPLLFGYTDTIQAGIDPAIDPVAALVDPAFEPVRTFLWQVGFPSWRAALAERGYAVDQNPNRDDLWATNGRPDEFGLAPAHFSQEDSPVAFLTDAAIDELTKRATDPSRWLAHVTWLSPHPPLTAAAPYHRLIDPADVPLPVRPNDIDTEAARHPFLAWLLGRQSLRGYLQRSARLEDLTERDDRHIRAAYHGMCGEVDTHVGRLMEHLRAKGQLDHTLIIFTADHGEQLGDHWLFGLRGFFDPHFHVPCIIRDPRLQADETRGTKVDALTEHVDLAPTIYEALGLDQPGTVEGSSLVPHLDGTDPTSFQGRDHVICSMDWRTQPFGSRGDVLGLAEHERQFVMVRTDRHKYVHFPGGLAPLLFDIGEDPDETRDLASDPTRRGLRHDMAALAVDYLTR